MKQQDVVLSYIEKYKNLPTRTIARIMYKENPLLFSSYDVARSFVLYHRKNKPKYKPYVITPGIKNLYNAYEIKGNYKVLILSDIHIPFHDEKALLDIFKKKINYDIIILNGDILDCYALSNYVRDPRLRDFSREVEIAKEFFLYLRKNFKKAEIIFKYGNHEERYERFLFYKAPELFGINEFELNIILKLNDFGIKIVNNKQPIKLNELYILHGHEYRGGSYTIVNPARTIYLKTKKNTIVGHYHQPSSHQEPNIDKNFVTCWSTGCLCDLNPQYMPLNKWALGYAIVETYGTKEFNVNNLKIINGKTFNT